MREPLNHALAEAITAEHPWYDLLSHRETVDSLESAGVVSEYSILALDYETTGRLDERRLDTLAQAVGADHVAFVRAEYGEQAAIFDGLFREVAVERRQVLGVRLKVWSRAESSVVWEASALAEAVSNEFYRPRRVRELAEALAEKIAARMPFRGPDGTMYAAGEWHPRIRTWTDPRDDREWESWIQLEPSRRIMFASQGDTLWTDYESNTVIRAVGVDRLRELLDRARSGG